MFFRYHNRNTIPVYTNFMENLSRLKDLTQLVDQRKSDVDALRPLTSEQEGRIMQKFRLDWNYHSNAIEGNSLTYGETIAFLMEGLTAKGKPLKDHLDIRGHNEGINYLMHFIQNRDELSEKVIRELHEMILVEPYSNPAQTPDGQMIEKRVTLGAYKSVSNHVKTYYYALRQADAGDLSAFVEYIGENLLHSLDIQLKGAKGESMEEPDDLDKEIALLKGSLGEDEIIPKSDEVIKQLVLQTFLPLFEEMQKQCKKLDDLFFSNSDALGYKIPNTDTGISFEESWEVLSKIKFANLLQVSYVHNWSEFKKSEEPFSIIASIIINFHRFKFQIETTGLIQNIKFSKNYSQKLTPEEFTDLSKIFVREALEQIKARTGK